MKKLMAVLALTAFMAVQTVSASTTQVNVETTEMVATDKPSNKAEKSEKGKECSTEKKKSCEKTCSKDK